MSKIVKSGVRVAPRRRVVEWVEEAIASGTLGAGEAAPSERELAASLGIARNTVAAGLADCEQRGVLVRRSAKSRKRVVPSAAAPVPGFSSETIAILGNLNHSSDRPRWSDRFLSSDILARLTSAGKHVMLLNCDAMTESDVNRVFLCPPAGMILTGAIGESPVFEKTLAVCRERKLPVVVYGNREDFRDCDRVYSDHRLGARQITEWLISRKRKRILPLFAAPLATYWQRQRIAGYEDAMRAAGLAPLEFAACHSENISLPDLEKEFMINRAMAVSKIIELGGAKSFDAVLCVTDHHAKVVISALRLLGAKVGGSGVLVAGYDNIVPDVTYAPFEAGDAVVSIDKHNESTAMLMADLMLARMAGKLPAGAVCRVNPAELIIRETK